MLQSFKERTMPKLKDWITLRDQGLLGDLKRKNQKRKETMLQLFGTGHEEDWDAAKSDKKNKKKKKSRKSYMD